MAGVTRRRRGGAPARSTAGGWIGGRDEHCASQGEYRCRRRDASQPRVRTGPAGAWLPRRHGVEVGARTLARRRQHRTGARQDLPHRRHVELAVGLGRRAPMLFQQGDRIVDGAARHAPPRSAATTWLTL
jgi:hypothetical protein